MKIANVATWWKADGPVMGRRTEIADLARRCCLSRLGWLIGKAHRADSELLGRSSVP